ncbi:hypothetical protein ACFXGA_20235 [Actinosynnema sp. NPDC059335]|uniref:hypothetical protein n=1 Tax=Actinosynnema sp. NPDC059335 TaxID=3346804 RepID=UPI0036701B2A
MEPFTGSAPTDAPGRESWRLPAHLLGVAATTPSGEPAQTTGVVLVNVGRGAVLSVAGHARAPVRVTGFGRFFPARTVHLVTPTAAVAADHCRLEAVDHYHIASAGVRMDQLRELSNRGRQALSDLVADPGDAAALAAVQEAAARLVARVDAGPPEVVTRRVVAEPGITIDDPTLVQTGDRSTLDLNLRYVAEETVFPLAELLVGDADLCVALAHALAEPSPGERTAGFLRALVTATRGVDDETGLRHTPDLDAVPATDLLAWFGLARAENASVVMIGHDNRVTRTAVVDRPDAATGDLLRDLNTVRRQLDLPEVTDVVDLPPTPALDPVPHPSDPTRDPATAVEESAHGWDDRVADRTRHGPARPDTDEVARPEPEWPARAPRWEVREPDIDDEPGGPW